MDTPILLKKDSPSLNTMSKTLTQTITFPKQQAEKMYAMFLDSKAHTLLTGGGTAKISAKEGTAFSAWDGYIHGKNLNLDKGRLIVQSWRAADWEDSDPDSTLILEFIQVGSTVKIIMTHVGVPDKQAAGLKKGWDDYYWKPWKTFLKNS